MWMQPSQSLACRSAVDKLADFVVHVCICHFLRSPIEKALVALALIRKIIAYFMFDIGIRVLLCSCVWVRARGWPFPHRARFIYDLHLPINKCGPKQNCLRHTATHKQPNSNVSHVCSLWAQARAHTHQPRSHMTTIKDAALSTFNRLIWRPWLRSLHMRHGGHITTTPSSRSQSPSHQPATTAAAHKITTHLYQ